MTRTYPAFLQLRALLFAGLAIGIYAVALAIVRTVPALDDPELLSAAVTLDLVALVPAIYYLLLVRSRIAPAVSLLPVILLSFAVASRVIPEQHQTLLHVLSGVLPLAELALGGWVGLRIWRLTRSLGAEGGVDVHSRLQQQLRQLLGSRFVAELLAYELSIVYYLFRPTKAVTVGEMDFSHHRKGGYGPVLAVLLMVGGVELFGIHLLLQRWSTTAAVLHILLSLYGMIWLVGDFRALRARPHRLTETHLEVRTGLRWSMDIPWARVVSVRRAWGPTGQETEGYRALVPLASIDYLVTLDSEMEALGPYGIRKPVQRIGIQIDDKERFEARLGQLAARLSAQLAQIPNHPDR